jgi:hypothetical protein
MKTSTLYQRPMHMQNAEIILKNMCALGYCSPLHSYASYSRAVVGKVSLLIGFKMLCVCS